MAMAGLMKGHGGYNNNVNRKRPYGMMLLLAFGAAIIAVMILHRFRERRIFNLLIKEKDSDLVSLQLLLQKERAHVKEAKWKLEDMRAKILTLRAQKQELDSRITEMQSTVSSLREEQRTIEFALEEKENEIKMPRHKHTHVDNENEQVKVLSEAYRNRESGNQDLKNQNEARVNVWSVSTDDPSNASVNVQMSTGTAKRDEMSMNQGKESSGGMRVSTNQEAGENLTEHAENSRAESGSSTNGEDAKRGDFRRENEGETTESRKITEVQSQKKQDHYIERNTGLRIIVGEGKKSEKSENEEQSWEQGHFIESNTEDRVIEGKGKSQNRREEMGTAKRESVGNHHGEAQRPTDETNEGYTSGDQVTKTTGDSVLGSIAEGAENQEHGANLKGGTKSQILVNSQIGKNGRKPSYLKRAKGKRWTIITRSKAGNSKNHGAEVMSGKTSADSTSSETLDNSEPRNKQLGVRNETGPEDAVLKISDVLEKVETSENEDGTDVGQDARNTAAGYLRMKERERTNATSTTSEMAHIPLKEAPTNMTLQIDDSKASGGEQSIHEMGQSGKEASGIHQQAEEKDRKKEDNVSDQSRTSNFDGEPNSPEIEDFQEQESETETSRETASDSEADGEERK